MGVAEGTCTIEKRIRMKRYILLLVLFGIFFVLPNLAAADCTGLGGFSSFAVQGTIAMATIPVCFIVLLKTSKLGSFSLERHASIQDNKGLGSQES